MISPIMDMTSHEILPKISFQHESSIISRNEFAQQHSLSIAACHSLPLYVVEVNIVVLKSILSSEFLGFPRTAFSIYIVVPAPCINPIESQTQTALSFSGYFGRHVQICIGLYSVNKKEFILRSYICSPLT